MKIEQSTPCSKHCIDSIKYVFVGETIKLEFAFTGDGVILLYYINYIKKITATEL